MLKEAYPEFYRHFTATINITFSYANQKYDTKVKKNMGLKPYSSEIRGKFLHPL